MSAPTVTEVIQTEWAVFWPGPAEQFGGYEIHGTSQDAQASALEVAKTYSDARLVSRTVTRSAWEPAP